MFLRPPQTQDKMSTRSFSQLISRRMWLKWLKQVLGVFVTLLERAYEREISTPSLYGEWLDVLFAHARVHFENKPRQIGLNHDYKRTCFNFTPSTEHVIRYMSLRRSIGIRISLKRCHVLAWWVWCHAPAFVTYEINLRRVYVAYLLPLLWKKMISFPTQICRVML